MKITNPGIKLKRKYYYGICPNCKCEFTCNNLEVNYLDCIMFPPYGGIVIYSCPNNCGINKIQVYSTKKIRDSIKNE